MLVNADAQSKPHLNENFRESDAIFILEKNRTVGPKYYRWNLGKWNEKTKYLYEIENFF